MSADGTVCIYCETDDPCSDDNVQIGLNFFKLHDVNIRSSVMTVSVWLRLEWQDTRLAWDAQCYGGLDVTEGGHGYVLSGF